MAESNTSSGNESEDTMKDKFIELCHELNMDSESQDTAWTSYKKIDQSYILEASFIGIYITGI